MEAVNATLAQQTGYCEGATPLHAIPIGLCSCAATQRHLFSDVLYLNCPQTACLRLSSVQRRQSAHNSARLAEIITAWNTAMFACMLSYSCLCLICCFGVPAVTQTPPVQTVGPHVASLGMKFYTGDTSCQCAAD